MEGKIFLSESVTESTVMDERVRASYDDIALRIATDADADFLREVFSSTRVDEFTNAGMLIEQIEPLLASQFFIQHDSGVTKIYDGTSR